MSKYDAVAKRREELRFSRAKLAKLAGISAEGMRLIEMGTSTPRPDTSAAIARALNWPPDALDRLAAGEDPASFEPVEPTPEPQEVGRLDLCPPTAGTFNPTTL